MFQLHKNPAYGRQRISWPMRIDGPILFWIGYLMPSWRTAVSDAIMKDSQGGGKITSRNYVHFLMYMFNLKVLMPSWRTAGTDAIVKNSLIMWPEGLMRGLEKTYMKRGQNIYTWTLQLYERIGLRADSGGGKITSHNDVHFAKLQIKPK